METTTIKKILVVVLDNLGDAVMATAIFKPLKRLYPHAQIGLWTKKYAGELFLDQSLIDFHHASDPFWDKAPGHGKGSWKEFVKTLREIRHVGYDLAFVLNADWRRSGALWLAGVPERVGLSRKKSRFFLTRALPVNKEIQHFVNDHVSLIPALGGMPMEAQECLPRLEINSEDKKVWEEWSRKTKWEQHSFVVIHPFSGDDLKTWPLSCWVDLVQTLLTEGAAGRFLFVCGPGEEGRLQQLISNIPSAPVQILAGASLSEVKAIVGHARALVGGDSGLGHIASALGVPVLSLFGNTNPARSRPLGHGFLRLIHKNPIQSIAVSEVKDQLLELLREQKNRE